MMTNRNTKDMVPVTNVKRNDKQLFRERFNSYISMYSSVRDTKLMSPHFANSFSNTLYIIVFTLEDKK
jgi:hypothetical protein